MLTVGKCFTVYLPSSNLVSEVTLLPKVNNKKVTKLVEGSRSVVRGGKLGERGFLSPPSHKLDPTEAPVVESAHRSHRSHRSLLAAAIASGFASPAMGNNFVMAEQVHQEQEEVEQQQEQEQEPAKEEEQQEQVTILPPTIHSRVWCS